MIINKLNRLYRESTWHRVDVYVFGMLILALMLYQLQFLVPQFSSFHVREVLYAFLYFRVIFFYRIRMTGLLVAVLIFLAFSVLVGLHTYYLYDFAVALHGFTRFVHLALIAPLAALILTDDDDVMLMFYLWMAVVFAGIMTVLCQILGMEMQWLVQKYIAIRGDLIRYKSL